MSDADRLRWVGDRIESLVKDLESHSDPKTRTQVDEVVRLLVELYGSGLTRIMEVVDETAADATDLFGHFLDDELVASLLVLHDLHPLDLRSRVVLALERVAEGAGPGTEVALVALEDGVAKVRLTASGFGCGSGGAALRIAVEEELARAVPDVKVVLEAVVPPAPPPVVPIALRRRPTAVTIPSAGA